MGQTITEKVLDSHLQSGDLVPGEEIGINVDQVLLTDTNGTMAWLQFEALELESLEPELIAQYCDHQSFQFDFRNTDDHEFLKSAAETYGAWFSRPGNGVCHQVHHEWFAAPNKVLLGTDSHTPTQGGLGMFSIGAGGLDVTVAMAGEPHYFAMPEIVEINLTGELPAWATAKDVILELLRRYTVKGGVGRVFEYIGPGLRSLPVPERCTLTNMGTELGATSSIVPSDSVTRDYLRRLGREDDYEELRPDPDAEYDDRIEIDLSTIEPLIACPGMPDNVVPVTEVAGTDVDQVIIGSCTNGAFEDIKAFADTIGSNTVHEDVHAIVQPASKQATEMAAREGVVTDMMAAGVNWSEATCGACCGIGHVPGSDSVSVRTFNRNFVGRSGKENDKVYLCSPQVAAVAAVEGKLMDPREYGRKRSIEDPGIQLPDEFSGSQADLIEPDGKAGGLRKGPHIGSVPINDPLADDIHSDALLKVGDDITTDHIIPARSDILKYRSNVAKMSEHTLSRIDKTFADRAKAADGGFVVAGENYGQGSSREHAALCPMFLGVDGVIAKTFARIHKVNLINFGLLPLTFSDQEDYDLIDQGDKLTLSGVRDAVTANELETQLTLVNESNEEAIPLRLRATDREREYLAAGGRLAFAKRTK